MGAFACTSDERVVRLDRAGGEWSAETVLEDVDAHCVAAAGEQVMVGARGAGALLSADRGATWERVSLPEADVYSVAIGAADGALYAGTEPSRLFVRRDGGGWAELQALQDIPSRGEWSFPPRPWTHHVRWIAPDPQRAERLLVGIELGGLMYSDDGGSSFTDRRPGAKRDVHNIAWHPSAEGRAYQAAGDGAAWSRDGGLTWDAADSGRDLPYCWALALDPADPERWYVSAARGPGAAHRGEDAEGSLYRWDDGAWREVELPGGSMPYALAWDRDELLVGMADGRVIVGSERGESWEETGVRIGSVLAMAADGG
jgi:hypothetical protein